MSARPFRLICLLLGLFIAGSAVAQEGHPIRGTWIGEWSPTPAQKIHVVLFMDYDNTKITGILNPGPNGVPLKLARLDIEPGDLQAKPPRVPTFKVHIEADSKDAKGAAVSIVADGTMTQVALPNRGLEGTWTQTTGGSTQKGTFKIRRQF